MKEIMIAAFIFLSMAGFALGMRAGHDVELVVYSTP